MPAPGVTECAAARPRAASGSLKARRGLPLSAGPAGGAGVTVLSARDSFNGSGRRAAGPAWPRQTNRPAGPAGGVCQRSDVTVLAAARPRRTDLTGLQLDSMIIMMIMIPQ